MGPTLFFPPTIFIFFIIVFSDGESFCGDYGKIRGVGGKRESFLLSALVGDTNVIIDDVDLAFSGGPGAGSTLSNKNGIVTIRPTQQLWHAMVGVVEVMIR